MLSPGKLIMCVVLAAGLQVHAAMTDREIADESIAHAAVLLNADVQSECGKRLLAVAKALEPESDDVLLVTAYLDRSKTPPAMKPDGTLDDLMNGMKERGIYLLKRVFPRNDRVAKLALVYLRTADSYLKNDSLVIKGLAYLKSYDHEEGLDELLGEGIDLENIYQGRTAPQKIDSPKLGKTDKKLAVDAINLASGLLAQNGRDRVGAQLLRIGLHLDPGNVTGLQVKEQIKRGASVTARSNTVGKPELLKAFIERARVHYQSADSSSKAAHLALLHLRAAELLAPNDPKVILGLTKLERKGKRGTLRRLLKTDLMAMTSNPTRTAILAVPRRPGLQFPDYTTNTTPSAQNSTGVADPRKLEFSLWAGRRNRKAAHGDFDDMMQHLDVRITVENWMKCDVDGYKMKVILIGREVVNKRRYGVVGILEEKLNVQQKREQKITRSILVPYDDTNSVRYGHKYYGYVVFIYRPDGTEFKRHASTSGLHSRIDEIKKYNKGKSFGM